MLIAITYSPTSNRKTRPDRCFGRSIFCEMSDFARSKSCTRIRSSPRSAGSNNAMAAITKISQQKRRPNRRNVYLDGKFAFGCNVNVIAKFRLSEGMTLDSKQIDAIKLGEVKQECFDAAMRLLARRLHSREEMLCK